MAMVERTDKSPSACLPRAVGRALALLDLLHLSDLTFQYVERPLLSFGHPLQLDAPEQHLKRITDAANLPAIAADFIQYGLLDIGPGGRTSIDVDEADLRSLLIESQRIDGLPQLLGRQGKLHGFHGMSFVRSERLALSHFSARGGVSRGNSRRSSALRPATRPARGRDRPGWHCAPRWPCRNA